MSANCPWCNSELLSDLERRYFACYSFVSAGFRKQSLRCKLTCTQEELKHAKELLQTVVLVYCEQDKRLAKTTVYLPDLWYAAAQNLLDKEGENDDGNMPLRPDAESGLWRPV